MTRPYSAAPLRRCAVSLVAAVALAVSAGAAASASLPKPAPGSPKQVLALVKASDLIHKLPQPLDPGLDALGSDDPPSYYPQTMNGCTGTSQCVFGDVDASTVVVLLGDSHALMWLPALAPVASRDGFRLVVEWMPGCPAATVTVWNPETDSTDTACNAFRTKAIADAKQLDPTLVLLADRTSYVRATRTMLIPDDVWLKGEEETIAELRTKTTEVAVVGDITIFNFNVLACLQANTKNVQSCSVANPNPKFNDHFAQEKAAAKAESVPYLNPQPWLCTDVCSPVIGDMGVYFDSAHVSSTYAEYLARLWSAAIKPLLARHPAPAASSTR